MPAAEVDIDASLVRSLLDAHHPDLSTLALKRVGEGWDNVMFRLGRDLAVRVPRRAMAAPLVLHEQRWLPELAPRLPLRIPVPIRVGGPTDAFPWSWSVVPWIDGEAVSDTTLRDPHGAAVALGEFVRALARPAPPDAPPNPYRGVPLAERATETEARIAQLADEIDAPAVLAVWRDLAATPVWLGPKVWLHGDLYPGNIVATDGVLSAVIDFGDITSGDPATDLAAGWMLFEGDDLAAFRSAAGGCDDDTWRRARAWALLHAVACISSSADNARVDAIGRATFARVVAAGV